MRNPLVALAQSEGDRLQREREAELTVEVQQDLAGEDARDLKQIADEPLLRVGVAGDGFEHMHGGGFVLCSSRLEISSRNWLVGNSILSTYPQPVENCSVASTQTV